MMVRNKILIGVVALFAASACLLLLGAFSGILSGTLAIPFVDPHAIPFVDPHAIPFVDPHAIPFVDPHAIPFVDPHAISI